MSIAARQGVAPGKGRAAPVSAAPRKPRLVRVPGDYATPQDAFDQVQEGDCVFLSPQEFILTSPLRIDRNVHVMGESEMGERATIKFDGGDLQPAIPLLRTAASNCKIQGVNFSFTCGNSTAEAAKAVARVIDICNGGDVLLTDCLVQSTCGGITVGPGSYTSLNSVKVEAKYVALDVKGRCFLDRSTISEGEGTLTGVRVAPLSTLTMERSTVKGCTIGVDLGDSPGRVIIKSSTVSHCNTGIAVCKNDAPFSQPPEIKGNTISECHRGIFLEGDGCVCDVSKNFLSQCAEAAICCVGGQSFVTSNVIKNCPNYGIEIRQGKPQLSSNVFQACDKAAVSTVGLTSLPVLLSNEISRCPVVGILVTSGSAPTVECNVMTENQKNILIQGALGLYRKNELLVSEEESIAVEGELSNVVIEENEFLGSATSCGVSVCKGATAIIASNIFAGTKLTAIVLKGCGASEVVDNEMDPDTCKAGAVVAQHHAIAKIYRNHTNGLAVSIFSDSCDTATSDQQ